MSNAFNYITTTTTECSEYVDKNNSNKNGSCSDVRIVHALKEYIKYRSNYTDISDENIIPTINKYFQCEDEYCSISNKYFIHYVRDKYPKLLPLIRLNLLYNFKPLGPRYTDNWLDNYQIDKVLQDWARVFPLFFNFDTNLTDFEETRTSLATIDIIDILEGKAIQDIGIKKISRKCNTIACVLNTCLSTTPGEHWVALFIDCRTSLWKIEYFDSTGMPPSIQVIKWVHKTKKRLEDYKVNKKLPINIVYNIATSIAQQKSQTECGPYSLYFIRSRLDNLGLDFNKTRINDEEMYEFRKHLFISNDRKSLVW